MASDDFSPVTDDLVARNRAASGSSRCDLPAAPALKVAIVACMDARMDEDEPCDVNLECPLEPFDISKCLKRHKGVLKMGVNHAVRFTLNAENLFVSPLPGSTIFLDDEVVTDKMTKMLEDGSRLRFAKSEYVLISEGFCPLPSWDAVVSSR